MNERREEKLEERVLVLAPTERDARICRALLEGAGLHVLVCSSFAEICRELSGGAAALLLTEEAVDGQQMTELTAALANQPPWSHLPVILLTPGGVESRLGAWTMQSIDNVVLLERPIQGQTLLSAVAAAIKSRRRQYQMREYLRERERTEAALRVSEEELREKERDLRAMFENAASGIVRTDGRDRFVAVNDHVCQMLGYAKDELVGMSVHELTYPEDRHKSDELNAKLREGVLSELKYEKRYMKKDGLPLWVYVAVSAARNEMGQYLYSVGTVVDITERKRAESALKAEQARWKGVVEGIADEVWLCDRAKRISLLNLPEITGMKLAEFADYSIDEVLAEVEILNADGTPRPPDEAPLFRSLRGEIVRGEEVMRHRRTGVQRHRQFSSAPTHDENGVITGAVAIVRDVTDLRQAEAALRKSEEALRTMADAMPQLAWVARPDGWIYWYNRRWYEYTGTTPEEMEGWGWQRVHDPERLSSVLERWKASIESGTLFEMVFPLRGADGLFRPFLTRIVPLKDDQGRVQQWFGTNTDISGQKRLENELREAQTSAERANAAKDEFLAVLSHELRTPLSPVLAAVQLMERKGELSENGRQHVEVIKRNLELEARLIDDLLDLTRIVRGKVVLDKEALDIRKVIERVAEVCKPDIDARNLRFSVNCSEGSHTVYGDPSRLQQVVWNLVKNGIKFTPDGGLLEVRSFSQSGNITIEVSDTGIGIEPEAKARIFDAFEQGDGRVTRQFGGLGLGLAISKRLVEMHEGSIEVRSGGKGQGSTFIVTLPAYFSRREEKRQPTEARTASTAAQAGGKRILLVEDHGDTAMMMRMLLESTGYQVETAGDVEQALDAAATSKFNVIVSDIGLPDRTGFDLMRELRQRGNNIKGVALSGYGRDEDIQRAFDAGFNAHLTKPVDFDTLISTVEGLI